MTRNATRKNTFSSYSHWEKPENILETQTTLQENRSQRQTENTHNQNAEACKQKKKEIDSMPVEQRRPTHEENEANGSQGSRTSTRVGNKAKNALRLNWRNTGNSPSTPTRSSYSTTEMGL